MQIRLLDLLNQIDEAIENEEQSRALQLILNNWYNLPDAAPLRERTAMVLATVGRKREAVEVYSRVARHYANAGFPTRALAAIKQMQNLNPSSTQLLDHFTTLYSVRSPFLERGLEQSNIPEPASNLETELSEDSDLDDLFEEAIERATDPDGTAERPGSLPALPLLSLLPPKALRRLLDFLEYEIYAESQPVVSPDDATEDRDLFWAVSADLYVKEEDSRVLIPPGTLLGVSAFRSQPGAAVHTVISQKGSECLRLSRDNVEKLTEEFPDLPNRLSTLYRHALTERLFRRHPMFAELGEAAVNDLPPHLIGLKLTDGTRLLRQGKVSPGLYIILDGQAHIVHDGDDGEVELDTLKPGDMLGEVGLVDPRPTIASAITEGPGHVLFCPRDAFLEFAEEHPSVAEFADRRAQRRIDQVQNAITDGDLVDAD